MSEVTVRQGVYRDWWAGVAVFAGVAVVGAYETAGAVSVEVAARWALVTAAVGVAELGYLRWNLSRNHPPGRPGDPLASLGAPNFVTVVRGACFAAVAGFVVVGHTPGIRWLPAAFYGVGVLLDLVDGSLARHVGPRTVLGDKLDHAIDTLGFLVAPVVGILWGRLPVWYLSLAVARYAFKAACWQRARRGHPVDDLAPSRLRRYLAAGQMAFLSIALAPLVSADVIYAVAPVVLVPSLVFFIRDYLVVTRRVPG